MLALSAICGGALLVAAAFKVADPAGSRVALGTYGASRLLWPLVVFEGLLGVAVLGGLTGARLVAAGLFAVFAVAQGVVLARGGGGAPCGCLGARGTVSATSVARVAALVPLALFAGDGHPILAAAGVLLASTAALLLNRAPEGALDVAGEGPEIGSPTTLAPGLNLFTADGCRLCARVKRGLSGFHELDEERDAAVWLAAGVPGAPFAVVVSDEGRVQAKGTVNTAAQARALAGTTRRTFVGRATAALALGGLVRTGEAEAYHFCGHIYTTDSCPHPTGLPAHRQTGLPPAREGRPSRRRPRAADQRHRARGRRGGRAAARPGRPAASDRHAHPRLQGHVEPLPDADADRRRVVPLLQGPRPQARRLLLGGRQAHQRRQGADRLLLRRTQGLLRDVLPDEGPVLTVALITAAALAGIAGSWSPCGLSMIETLARNRLATATFAVGSLVGGAITFGGLAWLGTRLFGPLALVAVPALLIAAIGDAAGRRIVPQVRRQVPESWRRILPLPIATGLYGVLLGLGFTTFLLTYATWALAAACLAVGTPETGLAVGIAFGAGRVVPVALLPESALLGERPQLLRGLRGAVAVALVAAAAGLAFAPPAARAANLFALGASDPNAAAGLVAYQTAAGRGVIERDGGSITRLPGTHPAVTNYLVAWLQDDQIVIADRATLTPLGAVPAPGADALAISNSHFAWRSGRRILAKSLAVPTAPATVVARALPQESLGRPSLAGGLLTYDHQTPARSRILSYDLGTDVRRTLRSTTGAMLLAPTRADGHLLYVRSSARRQQLILGRRPIFATTPTARRDSGHEPGLEDHRQGYPGGKRPPQPPRPAEGYTATLWTTALDGRTAYVTRLRHRPDGRVESRILRVGL